MTSTRTAFTDSEGDTLELATGFNDGTVLFKSIPKVRQSGPTLIELDENAQRRVIELLTNHLDNIAAEARGTKIELIY